jgi:hypothetical protein
MGREPPPAAHEVSVLDAVGQEITSIVAPVSLCMFLCVLLVRLLRVDGDDATQQMQGGIASAAYAEQVRPRRVVVPPPPPPHICTLLLLLLLPPAAFQHWWTPKIAHSHTGHPIPSQT